LSAPATARQHRISTYLWRAASSTLGAKVLVAVTGLVMLGFLVGHMAGNLLVFGEPAAINKYGHFLKSTPEVIWPARIGLILAIAVHVFMTVRLVGLSASAREERYQVKRWRQASWMSRYMFVSGVVLLAFLFFHLFHFTTGWVLSDYFAGNDLAEGIPNIYAMVVRGFQLPWVVVVYVVGMIAVTSHLAHGIWSLFQTLGLNGRKFTPAMKAIGLVAALLLCAGFLSIPLFIVFGGLHAS
jgi:succinate dehydrogenase / fumarate reductase cytochrome b subunit